MAHRDSGRGSERGNWRMQWVASTLHTTSEHGVSSITTADAHTSAASSRLNWPPPHPRRFKWTRTFRRKTKSGLCACAITFQLASTVGLYRDAECNKWEQVVADTDICRGIMRQWVWFMKRKLLIICIVNFLHIILLNTVMQGVTLSSMVNIYWWIPATLSWKILSWYVWFRAVW